MEGHIMNAEDFIDKFHNLEGILLKEKKKSLFLLLDSHKSLIAEDHILQEINNKLIPKTYLEEIYKLEVLIYFKRSSELLEILKSGSDIAASKIIRQPWFVKSLLENVTTEDFVQNLFPQLSVVLRAKILKQILKVCTNDEFINVLFDSLAMKYGLKPAMILLPGCSVDKIKEILLIRNLRVPKQQLKLLHDKNPLLINYYYEQFYRKERKVHHLGDFSKYLSKKDPNLYVKLLLQYKCSTYQLGRKTTKKYVLENKKAILENPKKYFDLHIFQRNALVKQLGEDFPMFLKATLPKQLSELLDSNAFHLLKYYTKRNRYNLYYKVFEEVYKRNLFLNKEFVTDELLEFIENDEEREKWVDKFENQVEYIQYKRSSLAVSELKEQLLKCDDIQFRKKLLKYIVTTCSISKDYDALLDILKLFCKRFRNTDGSVLYDFLHVIQEKIKLDELTDEHWKYIHEIILIQTIRNLNINGLIVFEYSKFLHKNGKDFEEMIPIYMKARDTSLKTLKFRNEKFKDELFQKKFLTLVLKHYKKECLDDYLFTCTEVVLAIKAWNRRYPENIISVCEKKEIIEVIKKSVNEEWVYYSSDEFLCMKYLVCFENLSEEFSDIYFNHIDCLKNVTMTKWYLKYKPNIFQEKIDKVVESLHIKTKFHLMNVLRKYEHTGLVQIITNYYMEKLNDLEVEKKNQIVQLLASIMPKNNYLKLLGEHVPKIDTLDLLKASVEDKNLQMIQIALAKSVRFTTCQVEALPILLKYCRGDYFQSSLLSLYYCFNKVPEKSLKILLDLFLQKPVSLRKHSIFLAALAFPIKTNEELGQKIIDSDQNDSIRKHLFTSSYKYFLLNPLEQFWNVLRTYMGHITLHEKESLILLTDVHVVPDNYKCVFMKQVCKTFDDLQIKENKSMSMYYDKLMENMKYSDMKLLPSDLCIDIISKKLFKEEYKKNDTCVNFTTKFLMYGDNMRGNIQNVLKVLELYKQTHFNTSNGKIARSNIYSIFKNIFDKTMDKKQLRIPLLKEFPLALREEWKKVFSIQETIEEYLMLDLMILKYQDNKDITFYAGEINKMFTQLRGTYGDLITGLFKDFLSLSLMAMLGQNNYDIKLMKLLAAILEINSSLPNCLLVLQLLPDHQFDDEFIDNFNNVLKKLLAKDEIVQLYLNSHFKKCAPY